jgi:naphthoate synthase
MISELMDPERWEDVEAYSFDDITYHRAKDVGAVRIAFDRPEVRNAFRPKASNELLEALKDARARTDVGCILLTGNGPSPKDGKWAFSAGGDQSQREEKGTGPPGSNRTMRSPGIRSWTFRCLSGACRNR